MCQRTTNGLALTISSGATPDTSTSGFWADREQMRDLWTLIDGLKDALADSNPRRPPNLPATTCQGPGGGGTVGQLAATATVTPSEQSIGALNEMAPLAKLVPSANCADTASECVTLGASPDNVRDVPRLAATDAPSTRTV